MQKLADARSNSDHSFSFQKNIQNTKIPKPRDIEEGELDEA